MLTAKDLEDFDLARREDREAIPVAMKNQMRLRAESESFYMASVVLGYKDLTVHTHMPLCTFLDTCKTKRRMEQMPRSHFKTTLVTITKRIQDLVKHPGIRILIVGDTEPNACRHLTKIKGHFERNPVFRWLFQDRVWEDPKAEAPIWSRNSIVLPHKELHGEPSIDAIGARGGVVSRHYDILNCDDLIGEEEYFSSTEMAKTIDWFSGIESLFIPPERDREMDIPSTFWRTDDVYAFAEKFYGRHEEPVPTGPHSYLRGDLAVFRRANIEDGKVIFPEGFSMEYFERLRETNPERYAAQYMNNPYASEVSEFKEQYLRFYTWLNPDYVIAYEHPDGKMEYIRTQDLEKISFCDPHAGGSSRVSSRFITGSRAAVLTTGIHRRTGRVFILDCWIKRATTDKIISEIIRQNEKWMPSIFSIEANGLQKMLGFWLKERIEVEGRLDVPTSPYIPRGDKDGERRIRGLQPMFRAGQIIIQAGFGELLEEIRIYPRGPKDGLDALAQGLLHWGVGYDDVYDEEMEVFEQRMREQRSIVTGY